MLGLVFFAALQPVDGMLYDTTRTLPGTVMGLPAYMAPEQAAGDVESVGAATDVYGLGAVLYFLLCGRGPTQAETLNAALDRVRRGDFARPRSVCPTAPAALEAVVLKAMSLAPANRYESARALAEEVEHYLADEPVSAWREPWTRRVRRWLSRHRTAAVATAEAVVVLIAASLAANFLLDRKNRDLAAARDADEANFEQSHHALLGLVDLVINRGVLSRHLALMPVRREVLEQAADDAESLWQCRPDDRRLQIETTTPTGLARRSGMVAWPASRR